MISMIKTIILMMIRLVVRRPKPRFSPPSWFWNHHHVHHDNGQYPHDDLDAQIIRRPKSGWSPPDYWVEHHHHHHHHGHHPHDVQAAQARLSPPDPDIQLADLNPPHFRTRFLKWWPLLGCLWRWQWQWMMIQLVDLNLPHFRTRFSQVILMMIMMMTVIINDNDHFRFPWIDDAIYHIMVVSARTTIVINRKHMIQ